MEGYHSLVESFVTSLGTVLGIQVIWKDSDSRIDQRLSIDACRHTCDFCLQVKADSLRRTRCMIEDGRYEISKAMGVNSPDRGFFRPCHSGVVDYVYPVASPVRYLGAFFLGPWSSSQTGLTYPLLQTEYSRLPPLPEGIQTRIDHLLEPLALLIIRSKTGSSSEQDVYTSNSRINGALEYIQENFMKQIRAEEGARVCHLSTSRFLHVFKRETGLSFSAYVLDLRLQLAKELLTNTGYSVEYIAQLSGFPTRTYFSRMFHRLTGITARKYRQLLKTP